VSPSHAGSPELEGRVALITGGAVGIGRAAVLALARAGVASTIPYAQSGPIKAFICPSRCTAAQPWADEEVRGGGMAELAVPGPGPWVLWLRRK
jgi:NAD(P)-dependent dehydrogenase (short-subunit alcohol dehydrogenase family)